MKKPSVGAVANVALVAAALFVIWNARSARPPHPAVGLPADWEREMTTGIVVGPEDAPIQIVELMDFRCPFCREWSARLDSLRVEHPGSVRVSFHHWPLGAHPDALAAAVAAECADRQGSFVEFSRTVYAEQTLLGQRPWREFADQAGVPDLDEFDACAAQPSEAFPRIQHGIELAGATGARGTPTVWINNRVMRPRPSLDELRAMARR